MGIDSTAYDILLVLHIVAVVVGFGGVALNGVYGARAKAVGGEGGAAIGEASFHVTERWAERVIYVVPVLGIALVLVSDDVWGFDQLWIWLSIVLYAVGLTVSRLVLAPAARRMNELARELVGAAPGAGGPPPQAIEMAALEKKLAAAGGGLNLLVVVIIALMVTKPGF